VSRRGWALFAAMCIIWGLPYLFIRVAVEHMSPGTLVCLRTALGALILLPIALMRGELRPVLARWRWVVIFAIVEVITPWLLLGEAEQKLSSSLAGLLVAGVPLVGALIAFLRPHAEKPSGTQMVGLLVGLAGVAALVGLDFGEVSTVALVQMSGVVVCYAVGPVILASRLSDLPGRGVIAASLALSALVYLPFAIVDPPDLNRLQTIGSVLVLGVVCTAVAFILFFALIAAIGPTRSTVITYVNPAVAVLLGVTILGESVTAGMLVGFPLILAGSVLGARQGKRRSRRTSNETAGELAAAS
jgi:drug/metabolite transporter (DMT)-like permease